jgi:HNH endonuclease
MPLPSTQEERAKWSDETIPQLYERAKRTLRETDFENEDELWRNLIFIQYADPEKHDYLEQYRIDDIRCTVFGHACPVFFYGNLGVTETKEGRRTGRYIPRDIMLKVVRRDNYTCQECAKRVPDDEVEFDHVIPHAKGGPLTVENIRLLCRECNRKKSDSLDGLLEKF